jgi:GNAT superfamily N-acetyltransferase
MGALDIKFERLAVKDKDEYLEFLVEAYGDRLNTGKFSERGLIDRFWQWEYRDNPAAEKEAPAIWLARADGRIAGQFCLMPVIIKIGGGICRGGWCQDFMVLSRYRGSGIGRSLVTRAVKDSSASLDIILVAGTNDASHSIFKDAGFIDMGRMPLYIRPNFPGKKTLDADIKIKEIAHFDNSFDGLWGSSSGFFALCAQKDSDYLNWRFAAQPYVGYKVFSAYRGDNGLAAGYIVLREGRSRGFKTGVVTDIFASAEDPDIVRALLDHALIYFSGKRDIALIRCDTFNKWLGSQLKRRWFIKLPSGTRFMIKEIKDGLGVSLSKSRPDWFLNYADSDLDLSGQRIAG